MDKYEIILARKAQKEPDKMSDTIAQPIFEEIEKSAANPRRAGCNAPLEVFEKEIVYV